MSVNEEAVTERVFRVGEQEELKKIIRQDSLQWWQRKWDAPEKGRWIHSLIPQFDNWVNRKHVEINYYLTQMLSNHGCFRAYLYRFRHDESPECPAGCRVPVDVENVFFWWSRFAGERKELEEWLGSSLTPENIMEVMLETEENWTSVSSSVTAVMKRLREEEQEHRKTRGSAILRCIKHFPLLKKRKNNTSIQTFSKIM